MALPSASILKQFTTYTSLESGLSQDILQSLMREAQLGSASHHKRNVPLFYDEMKISANLVYSCRSGRLQGYFKSGTINEGLKALDRNLEDTYEIRPMAKYVNVFMVRGFLSNVLHLDILPLRVSLVRSCFQLCGK